MRKGFLTVLFLVIFPPVVLEAEFNWGQRKFITYKQLEQQFAEPDMIYAPFTFWFWDEPIQPDKMQTMAETMTRQRLNPGYAHGRMCMVGLPDLPRVQWLGPVWMEAFDKALSKAEAADCYFGYVDEYWWPSGRAADRTLRENPDLWAISLRWETIDLTGPASLRLPECSFAIAAQLTKPLKTQQPIRGGRIGPDGKPEPHKPATILSKSIRLISGETKDVFLPEGSWRIYAFIQYYHPGADGGRLNYLDDRVAPAFLKLAHQPYADRFGRRMGTSIPGVFVDNEGDYGYKLAWSDHLDRRYREKWNRDIRLWMPLLFDQDAEGLYAKARWEWFEVVSDIYSEYLGATSLWLEQRGMYCISNLWEESLMWQAGAVGDFMKTQRAYSLPGTDCLGLNALKPHDFKETQSVTEFEGRRMQSEIMGAAGFWGFNPITIKQVANAVTAWGISHVVPHGIFTTRKLEGNPWLPDWYEQNPMWPWLHLWTDFVRRASFINSHGHTVADVLVLNPMDSVWALSGPGAFDPALEGRVTVPAVMPLQGPENVEQTPEEFKKNSAWWCPPKMDEWFSQQVRDINTAYGSAIDDLTDARIEFLIADRHYMSQMQLDGKTLVRSPFRFKAIVLPPVVVLPSKVAEKILRFGHAGGYIYALGSLPVGSVENGMRDRAMKQRIRELENLPTFVRCPNGLKEILAKGTPGLQSHIEFYKESFPMLQQHRRIDGRDFFWLANNTHKSRKCTLRFPGLQGQFQIWDCETGRRTPLPSTSVVSGSLVHLDFDPYQAYWVVLDSSQPPLTETMGLNNDAVVLQTLEGPWTIQIEPSIQPPLEHKPAIPEAFIAPNRQTRPLENWQSWGLERFSGYVDYSITIPVKSAQGHFTLDLGKVRHLAEVWINGQSVGKRLWPPFIFDVSKALQPGKENQIRIRIGNLINNNYGQEAESGLSGPVQLKKK